MIFGLAVHTFRECQRRAFPLVALLVIAGLLLGSHLFQAFSFGAGELEAVNLALSGVFLAGLVHATFLGTSLVRQDLERGTLGLILTKPVGLAAYLVGRMLGLAGAALILCMGVAAAMALILLLPVGRPVEGVFGPDLYAGWGRVLMPVIVLEAAALATSTVASRAYAPLVLLALFVAGSLAGTSAVGALVPDFTIFALEARAAPAVGVLMLYTGVQVAAFLLIAYLVLASRTVFRSQS